MDDLITIRQAIEALKICDANYDGTNCDKCPLRDDRWNGAWWDDETDCHTKLMRDTAKLLETLSAQPDIIRCKDCVYQTESWSGIKYCEAHGDHIGKDYDYCSNARMKENG